MRLAAAGLETRETQPLTQVLAQLPEARALRAGGTGERERFTNVSRTIWRQGRGKDEGAGVID